jgi:hypothetical protein
VNVIPSFSTNDYHTYGEVLLAPEHAVVKHPKSLSLVADPASAAMPRMTTVRSPLAGNIPRPGPVACVAGVRLTPGAIRARSFMFLTFCCSRESPLIAVMLIGTDKMSELFFEL